MRYIEVTIQTDQSSTGKKFLSFLQTESFFTAGGHAHFGQAGRQAIAAAGLQARGHQAFSTADPRGVGTQTSTAVKNGPDLG